MRNRADVGQVGCGFTVFLKFPAQDVQAPVLDGDRRNLQGADSEDPASPGKGIDNVHLDIWFSAAFLSLSEDVRKTFLKLIHGWLIGVDGKGRVVGKRPDVIQAMDVIGMRVSKEQGIQMIYPRSNRLQPELRSGVD